MRKNISFSPKIEERAQAIIRERGFDGLSDLFAALVREEYERRERESLVLREQPDNAKRVSYRKRSD